MKHKFMAAAAVISLMTATGVSHAQTAAVTTLKQEADALKKQNEALELRLNKLEKQQAAQAAAQPAPSSFMAADLSSLKGVLPSCALPVPDGPLTFCGITVFGTIDAGVGYTNHGLPINGNLYLGDAVLNSKARNAYFGISPNNLSVSVLGIKGATEILPGLSGVFWASTNINPQSGRLANAPGSQVDNNGASVFNYSNNGDGSRGGQAFNDQLFVGLSSPTFGQLTFGRHRTFATDLVGAYDATGGASAFSLIGYSGSYVSGQAFTGNGRWDNSFKYRVEYGPVHAGAMYKFADGNGGSNYGSAGGNVCLTAATAAGCSASTLVGQVFATPKNDAAQFSLGGSYAHFDIDGVIGYYHQAITTSILSATQAGGVDTFVSNTGLRTVTTGNNNANTLATTSVSDATAGAIGAKYTWEQFKFYAGWSHIILHNPANNVGIGADNAQGGYVLSSVTNNSFYTAKLLDTFWVGAKYAYNPQTDIVAEYQHVNQNGYGSPANLLTCGNATINPVTGGSTLANGTAARSGACSGSINSGSVFVDYHFTKRFDVYGGVLVNYYSGGLAAGYFYTSNVAPTVGARFTF
ncbi:porin [uncultured Rhodoblastus sp.]|uniref:porin n=1 Tax=uncultured Rhodoblastus sp. TaxID=543037 RepID=UPI0026007F16|nr:porin [uncultured Rhodoblastus sp.]